MTKLGYTEAFNRAVDKMLPTLLPAHSITDTSPLTAFKWATYVCLDCPANVVVVDWAESGTDYVYIWTTCHGEHRMLSVHVDQLRNAARQGRKFPWMSEIAHDVTAKHVVLQTRLHEAAAQLSLFRRFENARDPSEPKLEHLERLIPAADALREGDVELALRILHTEDNDIFKKTAYELLRDNK